MNTEAPPPSSLRRLTHWLTLVVCLFVAVGGGGVYSLCFGNDGHRQIELSSFAGHHHDILDAGDFDTGAVTAPHIQHCQDVVLSQAAHRSDLSAPAIPSASLTVVEFVDYPPEIVEVSHFRPYQIGSTSRHPSLIERQTVVLLI